MSRATTEYEYEKRDYPVRYGTSSRLATVSIRSRIRSTSTSTGARAPLAWPAGLPLACRARS
eukprot:scaffold339960_cov23-Prasinocladus_malaysianus.AAC.1